MTTQELFNHTQELLVDTKSTLNFKEDRFTFHYGGNSEIISLCGDVEVYVLNNKVIIDGNYFEDEFEITEDWKTDLEFFIDSYIKYERDMLTGY